MKKREREVWVLHYDGEIFYKKSKAVGCRGIRVYGSEKMAQANILRICDYDHTLDIDKFQAVKYEGVM